MKYYELSQEEHGLKMKTRVWQNTDPTILTHWHTGADVKFTLTAIGSNEKADLQKQKCLSLVWRWRARSESGDCEGLCIYLGTKFTGK